MITAARSLPFPTPSFNSPSGKAGKSNGPASAMERLLVANATQHTEGSLQITTDEGDTVTLSFAKDPSVTYADLVRGNRGADDKGREHMSALKVDSSSQFSVQIQGDLNEQERADTEALVQRFMGAVGSFAKGDLEGAAQQLQPSATPDSLAGFSVELSQESNVTVARVVRRLDPPADPTPAIGAVDPSTSPAVPGVDAGNVAPQPIAEPVSADATTPAAPAPTPTPAVPSDAQAFADRLLQAVRENTARFDRLGKILGHAMESLHDRSNDSQERARIGDLIHAWRQRSAPDSSAQGSSAQGSSAPSVDRAPETE